MLCLKNKIIAHSDIVSQASGAKNTIFSDMLRGKQYMNGCLVLCVKFHRMDLQQIQETERQKLPRSITLITELTHERGDI
jgi:hypothetical protein